MELSVTRTSMWNNEKPCDEAFAKKSIQQHNVPQKTFDAFNPEYVAHTHDMYCHDGQVQFCTTTTKWFVDFATLEDLMSFVAKYGECIVTSDNIEIYDDYRE